MADRHCTAEGDDKVTVDFLSEGVSVELSIVKGKLCVTACASHGETASSWDVHEVEWALPEKEKPNG